MKALLTTCCQRLLLCLAGLLTLPTSPAWCLPSRLLGPASEVASASSHARLLRPGGTRCAWRGKTTSQLSNGSSFDSPPPLPVSPMGTRFVQVAGGASHSLALAADGTLYAWGYNNAGQLGDGTTTTRYRPVAVALPPNTRFTQVAAGDEFSLALAVDGTVYAWGSNFLGELGDGSNTAHITPGAVALPLGTRFTQVSAGRFHALALAADGTLYAWGYNYLGELGDGSTTNRNSPVPVHVNAAPAGTLFTQVIAGYDHSLALAADGTLYAWGYNGSGQLGNGTTTNSSTPMAVKLPAGTRFAQVASGAGHVLALALDGTLYAWGYNGSGQLGTGTITDNSTPMAVKLPTGTRFGQVAAGFFHSLALATTGNLYAWGDNTYGQLGNGTTADSRTPVAESSGRTDWYGVAAGPLADHSLVLGASAAVFTAGYNDYGQLGDGTTSDSPVFALGQSPLPVQLVAFRAWRNTPATVSLTWTTASEVTNAGFGVEKAVDGVHFGRLGFVAGAGSSATAHHYTYLDAAGAGAGYYRLAQTDLDGTLTYSPVQYVGRPDDGLSLYPNPTASGASLTGTAPGSAVRVLDALGRVVATATADATGTATLPAGLAAGVYVVQASAQTARLVVE